ncbi:MULTISPECIES: hybrid sensor histidine kinase/response regulator [Roseomonadaceae]|uniref:histidine kinase n=1 Tax=Falsiroseomonas oleicola TaxID=2801474 RepID=A0ABS6H5W2_9PROT|nr:ATP-binding protein [Roseomonas oleicola]MBU8544066.1 response regulator [Roseomonas oleicola]
MPPDEKAEARQGPGQDSGRRGWWLLARLAPFLALLPLALYVLVLLIGLGAERQADRREDVLRTANVLAAGLDSELRAALRALDALAGSQHLKTGDLAGFRQEAQRLLAREPYWFTIALTDGERQLLNLRYPEGAPLPPIQDLAAVGSVLRTGYAAPGGLVEGRISFRVPVRVDGAVRFALVATQEATTFAQLLDRAGLPAGWSALLLDGDGRLIARAASGRAEPEAMRQVFEQRRGIVEADGLLAMGLAIGDSRWTLVVAAAPRGVAEVAVFWLVLAAGAAALLAGIAIAAQTSLREGGHDALRRRLHHEALARDAAAERNRTTSMAMVSQELCAPLSGLLSYTDQLAGADLPPQAAHWVRQQREAGQALLALVGDVLDFARLEDGSLSFDDTDIEIAPLLEDCAALLRRFAEEKGLRLRLAINPGLPHWIRGDPLRLRQMVTKLLDNAIRATPAGEVVLSARLTPRPERVEVAVSDAGPAIPEAELPRLFDRFREAAPGDWRGFGLAICRRLVEAMGGAIGAEALAGGGNRFVFWVPFRPGASPALMQGGFALRLLVAEDVQASRMLLSTVLERAGHVVTLANDRHAVLAALRGGRFDMALLDLHMPGLGGLGIARTVRDLPGVEARLKLIAMTVDPAEQREADGRAAGFDAVLRRPFTMRGLLDLIETLRERPVEQVEGA